VSDVETQKRDEKQRSDVTGWDTDSLPGSYSRPLATIGWERVERWKGACVVWHAGKEKDARIGSLEQETQLGVLGTPSTAIYTVRPVQYPYDIMGYKLP
jgi:hypothetical protein